MATPKLLVMTTLQKSLPPLIAAVAGCVWLTALSSAEIQIGSRIAALRQHIAAAGADSSGQKFHTASKPANDRIQWMKLAKKISLLQARDARDRPAELELQRRLEAMNAAEILAMMDDLATWDLPDSGLATQLQSELLDAAVEKDPQLVLRHFKSLLAAWDPALGMPSKFVAAFAKWLKSDSAGATAWLDEMISSGKLICNSIGLRTNETCRSQMMADLTGVVIAGLLKTAPEQAIARFKSLASDQQQSLLRYNHPLMVEPGAQRGFVKLVREGMTEDQTDLVSGKHGSYPAMAYEMAHAGGFAKVATFLDDIGATAKERLIFAEISATSGLAKLEKNGQLDRKAVDEMRAWLAIQAPQDVDRITGKVLQANTLPDGASFKNIVPMVEQLYRETGSDELLVTFLDGISGRKFAQEQATMASWIKDDGERERILSKLKPHLPNTVPGGPSIPFR